MVKVGGDDIVCGRGWGERWTGGEEREEKRGKGVGEGVWVRLVWCGVVWCCVGVAWRL